MRLNAGLALLIVHATLRAVGAGKDAAFRVDFTTEGVSTAFGIDFENLRFGMIAPDVLALDVHVLGDRAGDVARGGAAIRAVEPAVGAPVQAVCHRLGILEAEAGDVRKKG